MPGSFGTSRVTIRLLIVIRSATSLVSRSTCMSMSVTSRPNEKALVDGLAVDHAVVGLVGVARDDEVDLVDRAGSTMSTIGAGDAGALR